MDQKLLNLKYITAIYTSKQDPLILALIRHILIREKEIAQLINLIENLLATTETTEFDAILLELAHQIIDMKYNIDET